MRELIIPNNPEMTNGKFYNDLEVIVARYIAPGTADYYSLISELLLLIGLKDQKLEKNIGNNII